MTLLKELDLSETPLTKNMLPRNRRKMQVNVRQRFKRKLSI